MISPGPVRGMGMDGAPGPYRPNLDVSHLPESINDHRSPIWVGNLILVLIETMMFCLLVVSYFYLRKNFHLWPPPLVNVHPAILNPLPSLGIPTLNLVLMLLSLVPMIFTDKMALKQNEKRVKAGLIIMMATITIIAVLRFCEFQAVHFRWDDNAYAAVVWTLLGLHLLHILIALSESIYMSLWIFLKHMDKKHARDVRVTAVYWYWVVGTWLPLYFILFIGPRM